MNGHSDWALGNRPQFLSGLFWCRGKVVSQTSGLPADWWGFPPVAKPWAGPCGISQVPDLNPCFHFRVPTFPSSSSTHSLVLCDVSWVRATTRCLFWPFPAGRRHTRSSALGGASAFSAAVSSTAPSFQHPPGPVLLLCSQTSYFSLERPSSPVFSGHIKTPRPDQHPIFPASCRSQLCMTLACSCLSS